MVILGRLADGVALKLELSMIFTCNLQGLASNLVDSIGERPRKPMPGGQSETTCSFELHASRLLNLVRTKLQVTSAVLPCDHAGSTSTKRLMNAHAMRLRALPTPKDYQISIDDQGKNDRSHRPSFHRSSRDCPGFERPFAQHRPSPAIPERQCRWSAVAPNAG